MTQKRIETGADVVRIARAFCSAIHHFIGSDRDIPAPDVGSNSLLMDEMTKEYNSKSTKRDYGVFTGKSIPFGGSHGRQWATGMGVKICLEKFAEKQGISLSGKTFILQGFGNVGCAIANLLCEIGLVCVGVGDHTGYIRNSKGIEIIALSAYAKQEIVATFFLKMGAMNAMKEEEEEETEDYDHFLQFLCSLTYDELSEYVQDTPRCKFFRDVHSIFRVLQEVACEHEMNADGKSCKFYALARLYAYDVCELNTRRTQLYDDSDYWCDRMDVILKTLRASVHDDIDVLHNRACFIQFQWSVHMLAKITSALEELQPL